MKPKPLWTPKNRFLCVYYHVHAMPNVPYHVLLKDDLDLASFADVNTPYSYLSDMISVLGQLKGGIDKIFDWFKKIFSQRKC